MSADRNLANRLDLLEQAGEVTARARHLTERAMERIEDGFGIRLVEANAAQLVTHLAVALTRIERGDPESTAPTVIDGELDSHVRQLEFSRALLADLTAALGRTAPEAEVSYMTAHLCVLTA